MAAAVVVRPPVLLVDEFGPELARRLAATASSQPSPRLPTEGSPSHRAPAHPLERALLE
jgi:hypothetical protein